MSPPRILVTNDDGIDSVGLHKLAQAMTELGEVVVVAPDREFSGAGAAIGPVHLEPAEVSTAEVAGIDEAYAVSGPPGLCVLVARMGAFGSRPDLIVSGINPGANVGGSVYHSGTIGACLTGRNGGITGIAVSQSVSFDDDVQGQGSVELLANQRWDCAAEVAKEVSRAVLDSPPDRAGVLNLNVPNLDIDDLAAWRWAEIWGSKDAHQAVRDPRPGTASLVPRTDEPGRFDVELDWGDRSDTAPNTDTEGIRDDEITVSWIGKLEAVDVDGPPIDAALNKLVD